MKAIAAPTIVATDEATGTAADRGRALRRARIGAPTTDVGPASLEVAPASAKTGRVPAKPAPGPGPAPAELAPHPRARPRQARSRCRSPDRRARSLSRSSPRRARFRSRSRDRRNDQRGQIQPARSQRPSGRLGQEISWGDMSLRLGLGGQRAIGMGPTMEPAPVANYYTNRGPDTLATGNNQGQRAQRLFHSLLDRRMIGSDSNWTMFLREEIGDLSELPVSACGGAVFYREGVAEFLPEPGPEPEPVVCAACGLEGHSVRACVRTDEDGQLFACPFCETYGVHLPKECTKWKDAEPAEVWELFVVNRGGKCGFRTNVSEL